MARQRNPRTRAVLLSDDESSRLLQRAQSFTDAEAGSVGATSPATALPGTTLVAPAKARDKLATTFRCPVCKRAESVECRIDARGKVAEASCRAVDCGAGFSAAAADALTEPIDVYCEWVDDRSRRASEGGGSAGRRDLDGDVTMADA